MNPLPFAFAAAKAIDAAGKFASEHYIPIPAQAVPPLAIAAATNRYYNQIRDAPQFLKSPAYTSVSTQNPYVLPTSAPRAVQSARIYSPSYVRVSGYRGRFNKSYKRYTKRNRRNKKFRKIR